MSFRTVYKSIKKHTRGAITILLIICMCPFLTVASILIEVDRYNNAVAALDELMGVSAMGTLGHFDKYLHKRFGLLSVSQERELDVLYNHYFGYNSTLFGKTIDVESVNAEGMLPLSDPAVLKRQIMEYAYLDAPTTLLKEALPIDELLGMLDKNLASIKNIFDLVGNASSAIDNTIKLLENAKKFKEMTDTLDNYKSQYSIKYNTFDDAAAALANAYSNVESADEEELEDAKKALNECITEFIEAKNDYSEFNKNVKTTMENYKELLISNADSLETISKSVTASVMDIIKIKDQRQTKTDEVKKIKTSMEDMVKSNGDGVKYDPVYLALADQQVELERQIAELGTKINIAEAGNKMAGSVSNSANTNFKTYTADSLKPFIEEFSKQFGEVSKVNVTVGNYDDYLSGADKDKCYTAEIDGYIPSSALGDFLESQKDTFVDSSFSAVVNGLIAFLKSLFKYNVFYDSELSATIDEEFYNSIVGGLPGGPAGDSWALRIAKDIGNIIDAGDNLAGTVWDGSVSWWENILSWFNFQKLIDILTAIKNLIEKILDLIKEIIKIAADIVSNLFSLFTGYNRWWLSAYSTYNMPCRTDNSSGDLSFSSMTGNKFSGSAFLAQQHAGLGFDVLGIAALVNSIKAAIQGGSDRTFSGAELEYIMFGSKSEIANQASVFLAMYFLRLIMDIPFIVCNAEVQSIAAASTIGYPIILILYILLEPLADMLVLVNNGDISLFKTTIYLTPSGLVDLIGSLVSIKFADLKTATKDAMISVFDASSSEYDKALLDSGGLTSKSLGILPKLFAMNYRHHCLILMLVIPTEPEQLARIQNIIQMEGYYHYRYVLEGRPFDLRKAYAGVHSEVSANTAQFLSLPRFSAENPFAVNRIQMRSY